MSHAETVIYGDRSLAVIPTGVSAMLTKTEARNRCLASLVPLRRPLSRVPWPRSRKSAAGALSAALLLTLAGCTSRQAMTAVDTSVCIERELRLIETESPALQQDGDVTMTVAPRNPSCEEMIIVSYAPRQPAFLEGVTGQADGTVLFLRRQEIRQLDVGDNAGFQVTINNQGERVFRGRGAVINYVVDGQNQAVDRSHLSALENSLVPPGTSRTVEIGGLEFGATDAGTVVALSLYDVAVERDQAGNPTRAANFEWLFDISTARREGPSTRKICDITMPAGGSIPQAYRTTAQALLADPTACP